MNGYIEVQDEPLHSEEVQEIVESVPSWILRWGISVILAVVLGIAGVSYFIRSPDLVQARVELDVAQRPQVVIPRRDGQLTRLFVHPNQMVKEGDLLGVIESTVPVDAVSSLQERLYILEQQIAHSNFHGIETFRDPSDSAYGELQPMYEDFFVALQQFKEYLPHGTFQQRAKLTKIELTNIRQVARQIQVRTQINKKELELAEVEYTAFKHLLDARVISPLEFKREEAKYLAKKIPVESAISDGILNSGAQVSKTKELKALESQLKAQQAIFITHLRRLNAAVNDWKKEYLLISEKDGKVIFNEVLQERQWVNTLKPIMYVQSDFTGTLFGKLKIDQRGIGKVQKGQEVVLKLDSYPAEQYGVLRGEIQDISPIPVDSVFTAILSLPKSGETSYHLKVPLRAGLVGSAQVVTKEYSLFNRFLRPFRSVLQSSP